MNPPAPSSQGSQSISTLLMFLLSANAFIVSAVLRVTDTLIPSIATYFQVSAGEISVIVTGFAIGFGLSTLIHGGLADRFGKLKIISIGAMMGGICTILCGFADNLTTLSVFRFLTGVFISACVSISMAHIADNVAYQFRQAAIGRYLTGIMFGTFFGGMFGGLIIDWIGWQAVFIVYGAVAFLSGLSIAAYSFRSPTPRKKDSETSLSLSNYLSVFRQKSVQRVCAITFIEGIVFFGSSAFLGALIQNRFGTSYLTVGLLLGCFGIGGLVYTSLVKQFVKYFNEIQFVLIGGFTVSLTILIFAFIGTTWPLGFLMGFLGFGFYMMHNTLQTKASEASPANRGIVMALFSSAIFLGQSVGASLIGHMIDYFDYTITFLLSSIAFAIIVLWFASQIPSGVLGSQFRK